MIEKKRHRLGEYQITEYEDGALWWVTHHGFGKQRTGRCLIHDVILLFGQSGSEEDGFLKREFLERIRRLPNWDKTEFYCFASELLDVSSGRSLNLISGSRILSRRNIPRSQSEDAENESPGTFRLDKYRITVAESKLISWKTMQGVDRVVGGQCMIHSGILFIGPKDCEVSKQASHEFFKELNETAPWGRTKIWGSPCGLARLPLRGDSYIVLGRRGVGTITNIAKNLFQPF